VLEILEGLVQSIILREERCKSQKTELIGNVSGFLLLEKAVTVSVEIK
jgi:hypothetical protein